MHPNCVAVDAVLEAAGCAGRVQILPEAAPTAVAAAAQLGVEVGAIANSLVFATAEDEPVLVLTSGAHRVDTAKVAALRRHLCAERAPTPSSCCAATGQRHRRRRAGRPSRDRCARSSTSRWPATRRSGRPAASRTPSFPTTYDELCTLTGGEPAEVA